MHRADPPCPGPSARRHISRPGIRGQRQGNIDHEYEAPACDVDEPTTGDRTHHTRHRAGRGQVPIARPRYT